MEIDNDQCEVLMLNTFQFQLIQVSMKNLNSTHIYVMKMNKMHVTHMLIFLCIKKIIESGILVSGMLKVWEDTDGCANKYRSYMDIYLMTVL